MLCVIRWTHNVPKSPNEHSVHSSVLISSAHVGITAVSRQILPPQSVFQVFYLTETASKMCSDIYPRKQCQFCFGIFVAGTHSYKLAVG